MTTPELTGQSHGKTRSLSPKGLTNRRSSTIAIIVLLRKDWSGGISAGVAWLVFLQVKRRLPPLDKEQ